MEDSIYKRGLALRKAVVGEEYVDTALADADEFSRPLQDLVTRYCWGEIWGREGVSLKTRSLLNLGMITALNRPAELAHHVRGALRNGCSIIEIREVLLQAGVYCGLPAAVDAFRVAGEIIKENSKEATLREGKSKDA